ncbi:MAG: trypsin-like peptidase domain-containing protein [Clostridia bacterium]|nr:trypsin-like peptidase domain-containing protein [Clostridia bacterium]
MKRRIPILSLLLVLLLTLSLLLSSCGTDPASAYDLAVKNGFVGTEEEWLASLKGQDLNIEEIYDKAVSEGFEGDFLAFLTEYLSLDSDRIAEAIRNRMETDTANAIAHSLLSCVEIQCSTGGIASSVAPSAGSGVIYSIAKNSGDCYIITNHHVVSYATADGTEIHSSIYVFLYGMEVVSSNAIRATYVGGTDTYDLAVLKVSTSEIVKRSAALPARFADSDAILAGQSAIAIGNAAAQGISVTQGIVSADSKNVTLTSDGITRRVIQVDAAINEGNSGGGLFDREGRLIGIVVAKITDDGIENMGYAIPSNVAYRVADRLIETYERVNTTPLTSTSVSLSKAQLGIKLNAAATYAYYDEEAKVTRLAEEVVVDSLDFTSPAKVAGLKANDRITAVTVDGTEISVNRIFTLQDAMLLVREGSTVILTYLRGGTEGQITMTAASSWFTSVP